MAGIPTTPLFPHSSPSFIQRITVKHPGYGGNNTILVLPACDGADATGRAHYATIHAACAIIANNRTDGWLSSNRSGEARACADSEGLIPAGIYFFHVESTTNSDPYPIVPNFRSWKFPHDNLPSLWQESAQNPAAIEPRTATETCRLTNKRLACETAHIIPVAEKIWFADNEMDQYGELGGRTGQDVADSPGNCLRLRRDVHILWDGLFFSIVPKESRSNAPDGAHDGAYDGPAWRVHSMVHDEELYQDYHNRSTESLSGRAVEYLYARFAWNIFPKVLGFLQGTQARRLAVRQSDGRMETRTFSPQECQVFTKGQGRGRSASPTKRSRGPDGKTYERAHDTWHEWNRSTKRKRRSASSERSLDFDSAVSDVDSTGDAESGLTFGAEKIENYWDLKGWAIQRHPDTIHCSDISSDDAEQSRGRKRYRNSP